MLFAIFFNTRLIAFSRTLLPQGGGGYDTQIIFKIKQGNETSEMPLKYVLGLISNLSIFWLQSPVNAVFKALKKLLPSEIMYFLISFRLDFDLN